MVRVLLYLAISYTLVIVVHSWVRSRGTKSRLTSLFVTSVLFALPVAPYVIVEILTLLFKPALEPAAKQMIQAIDHYGHKPRILSFKIIKMTPRIARVYVVTVSPEQPGGSSKKLNVCAEGMILDISKGGGDWQATDRWDTIWSDCGSANGTVFPPYPSKGAYDY